MQRWEKLGMSRASWYRHGKPKRKPRPRKTRAEQARKLGISIRTLQRRQAATDRRRQGANQDPAGRT